MRLDLLGDIHAQSNPLAKLPHKSPVSGIGTKFLQRGIPIAGRLRRKNARPGVVEICAMNHDSKQIAQYIDDNVGALRNLCNITPAIL